MKITKQQLQAMVRYCLAQAEDSEILVFRWADEPPVTVTTDNNYGEEVEHTETIGMLRELATDTNYLPNKEYILE